MTPTPTCSRLQRGIVTSLFAVAAAARGHAAQPGGRDYTCKVPHYTFSSTLAAQEAV